MIGVYSVENTVTNLSSLLAFIGSYPGISNVKEYQGKGQILILATGTKSRSSQIGRRLVEARSHRYLYPHRPLDDPTKTSSC